MLVISLLEEPEPSEVISAVNEEEAIITLSVHSQKGLWDLHHHLIFELNERGDVIVRHTTLEKFVIPSSHLNISTIKIVTKTKCSQESPP